MADRVVVVLHLGMAPGTQPADADFWWRAEQGEDVETIKGALEIPGGIALLAAEAPYLDGEVAAQAEVWDASRNGAGEEYQAQVYKARKEINAAGLAAEAVVAVVASDPHAKKGTLGLAQSVSTSLNDESDRVQALYRALPLESDAWEATTAVDAGFDGKVDQDV